MMTRSQLEIRPLKTDDLEAVVTIDARIAGRRRKAFFEHRMAAALAEPKHFIFMACEHKGVMQGYLQARLLEGEFGSSQRVAALDNIGVAPDSQGQGVGMTLMKEFKALLRHKGVQRIDTQADWRNSGFLKFLAASGFQLAPRQVLEREVSQMNTVGESTPDPYPVLESGDRDFSDSTGDEPGALARDIFVCRSLTGEDLPALIHIDRKVTGHDHAAYYERKVNEVLNKSGVRVSMVAEGDGQVVGFIMARVDYGEFDRIEPNAVLDSIAVNPELARNRVGSALLSQLLLNLTGLRLETIRSEVDADHLDVSRFLMKHGFAQSQELLFSLPLPR